MTGYNRRGAAPAPAAAAPAPAPEPPSLPALSLSERYLLYSRGGDYCSGYRHFSWSLQCALGEALYLNRTFVFDMQVCVDEVHNFGTKVERDARLYLDVDLIARGLPIVPRKEFFESWKRHNAAHPGAKVPTRVVTVWDHAVWLRDEPATIVWRDVGPRQYASQVCDDGRENKVIKRAYHLVQHAPHLMDVAWYIASQLGWDFDAVHVRRGDKALDKVRWPHLDADTQPESLLEKLPKFIAPGRTIYVATDERNVSFFGPLWRKYKVRLLEDFAWLWAPGSAWHNASRAIVAASAVANRSEEPEFDGQMQGLVDYRLFDMGKIKVETFNDLTSDPRHGIPW